MYVGIIAYRLGSIDPTHRRSFTELEYEHALELKKQILIYLADDHTAAFPYATVDHDPRLRRRLEAFKRTLRERHTVGTFSTAADLAEKLARDFEKHFAPRSQPQSESGEDLYSASMLALRDFRLTPKRYNGREVGLQVNFYSSVFPASRVLCRQFNLEYGYTVGSYVHIVQPKDMEITPGFREMHATGRQIDNFMSLVNTREARVYAELRFAEEDVDHVRAEFLCRSYYDDGSETYGDPNEVYVPPRRESDPAIYEVRVIAPATIARHSR